MESKKMLLEAKPESLEVKAFMDQVTKVYHPFVESWIKNYEKALKEGEIEIGAMRGQTVGDAVSAGPGAQVYATLEIFNAVIRGFTRYMDDSFVRKYTTESVIFKVPKTEYREAAFDISGGQLPHSEKLLSYATVDLSSPESEKGAKMTWTRALLEDITFDVQAELAEGLGHAIAVKILSDILTALLAVQVSAMPLGAKYTISSPITWEEFLAVIGAVDIGYHAETVELDNGGGHYAAPVNADIGKPVTDDAATIGVLLDFTILGANSAKLKISSNAAALVADNSVIGITGGTGAGDSVGAGTAWDGYKTYGPADFALVSPDVYWQLLNIIQMTNVLYEGSTDPVKKGVIKLALGTTIAKQSLLPKGTVVAVNSEKAIALVTRRALKIEPVVFPVWNEYGFIGTVRFGVTILFPGAIQIGQIA